MGSPFQHPCRDFVPEALMHDHADRLVEDRRFDVVAAYQRTNLITISGATIGSSSERLIDAP